MYNLSNKRVICPYCGYRMPISFSQTSECKGLTVFCKGRNCKRMFVVIIKNGVQRNLYPDDDIINAFKVAFGSEYKKHILEKFGVEI